MRLREGVQLMRKDIVWFQFALIIADIDRSCYCKNDSDNLLISESKKEK
jgi:hypothetical protein